MKPKICQWCGKSYQNKHPASLYCSPSHKEEMAKFFMIVGKRIAADAMAWRRARGSAKKGGADALQRLCKLLDQANEEFRNKRPEGAPNINEYVEAVSKPTGIRRGFDR